MNKRFFICAAMVSAAMLYFSSCIRKTETQQDCPPCVTCPASTNTIRVIKPDSNTVWQFWHFSDTITWDSAAGDSVQIRLYQDSKYIDFFPAWTENDRFFHGIKAIPSDWNAADNYQVQIIDRAGNTGWSRKFRIRADTLATIIVQKPDNSVSWKHGQYTTSIIWSVGVRSGDSVMIKLYQNGQFVCPFLDRMTLNNGSYNAQKTIQYGWGSGKGFQLQIVDNKGYYGWSRQFEITTELGELVEVTKPDTATVWKLGQSGQIVYWYPSAGKKARIDIYKNESLVMNIVDSADNTGGYIAKSFLPASAGTGTGYQIKITDVNGNFGYSRMFKIIADTLDSIIVVHPAAYTVWRQHQTGVSFRWTGARDSVAADLYRSDTLFVRKIFGWTRNDSEYVRDSIVPFSWDTGSAYRVKMYDKKGRFGFSDRFSISADTTPRISVLEPDSTTRWYPGKTFASVRISGEFGPRVKAELYRNGRLASLFIEWRTVDSTNTIVRSDPIPLSWTPGENYRLKVLDSIGNFGWSRPFVILPDSFAQLIVTSPDSGDVWYAGMSDIPVRWTDALGDSAHAVLYRGTTMIDEFGNGWTTVDSLVRSDSIPASWGEGVDFRIKVVDNKGYYGYSGYFEVRADSLRRISVLSPDSTATWTVGNTNTRVSWLENGADSMRIDVYRSSTYIALFGKGPVSDTAGNVRWYERTDSIPAAWGTGAGFRVKLIDNRGYYGWSGEFRMNDR